MARDPREVERLALQALERGRARAAVVTTSPVLALGVGVAWVTGFEARAILLAVVAYVVAALLWWRGTVYLRALVPGLVSGAFLLGSTFVAHGFGHHVCDLHECLTRCGPIGIAGGVASGLTLSAWAAKNTARWWVAAGAMSACLGAVGCSCIGFVGGIAGIGALALTALPAALLIRRPASPPG